MTIVIGPQIITVTQKDIVEGNGKVLDSLNEKRSQPAVLRYEYGNPICLDTGTPTTMTRMYNIAAFTGIARKPQFPTANVSVVYPDQSTQSFRLDNRTPQLDFFYDIKPLEKGETVYLEPNGDNNIALARLAMSSINPGQTDWRFAIGSLSMKDDSILGVHELIDAKREVKKVGFMLGDGSPLLEFMPNGNIPVTRCN